MSEREAETIEGRIADIVEQEGFSMYVGRYRVGERDAALVVRALRTISTTNGTRKYSKRMLR